MELKEFVKRSVLDITNAVYEARKDSELAIAPGSVEGASITEPQMINFEVVVTTGKEGGGGITVWSAASLKGQIASKNVNKIAFSVPVYFQALNPQREK